MRALILAAAFAAAASVAAAAAPWQAVEATHIGGYTLTVESQADNEDSPRIVITAAGGAQRWSLPAAASRR